jgi:hypothetical protein
LRLLVLDESRLLAWMVEQLCPPGTEVVGLGSFEEARRVLLTNPPDAAVVTVGPAHLPWRNFQKLCASRTPPVPVLYESCISTSVEGAGLEPDESHAFFLRTPAPIAEFEGALARLLNAAREAKRQLVVSAADARTT